MPICRMCSNILQKHLLASKSLASNALLDSLLQSYGGQIQSQARCKSFYRKETLSGLNKGDTKSVHTLNNQIDQNGISVECKRKKNHCPNVLKNCIHSYAVPKHVVKKKIICNKKFKTQTCNKNPKTPSSSGKNLDIHVTVFKGAHTKSNKDDLEQNQEDGVLETVLNLRNKKKLQLEQSIYKGKPTILINSPSKSNLGLKTSGVQKPSFSALVEASRTKVNKKAFEGNQEDGVLASVLSIRDENKEQITSKIKQSVTHNLEGKDFSSKDLLRQSSFQDFYKNSVAKGTVEKLEEAETTTVNSSTTKSNKEQILNVEKDINENYFPRKSFWDSVFGGSVAKTVIETNENTVEQNQEDALKSLLNETDKNEKEIDIKEEPSILKEKPTSAINDVSRKSSLDKIIEDSYAKAIKSNFERNQEDGVLEVVLDIGKRRSKSEDNIVSVEKLNSHIVKENTSNISDDAIKETEDEDNEDYASEDISTSERQQMPREKTLFDYVKRFEKNSDDKPIQAIENENNLYAVSNKLANERRRHNATKLKRDKKPGNSNTIGTVREMSAQVIPLRESIIKPAPKNENTWVDDLINFIYRKCDQNNCSVTQETKSLKTERSTIKDPNNPMKVVVTSRRSFSMVGTKTMSTKSSLVKSEGSVLIKTINAPSMPDNGGNQSSHIGTTVNIFEELKQALYLLFEKYPCLYKSFTSHKKNKRVIVKPSLKNRNPSGLPVILQKHYLIEDINLVNNNSNKLSAGVKSVRGFRTCTTINGFEDNSSSDKRKKNRDKIQKSLKNAKVIAKTLVDYSKKSYRKYKKVKEKVVKINNWIVKNVNKPTKSNTDIRPNIEKSIQLNKKADGTVSSQQTLECSTFDREELLKILRELKQQRCQEFDYKKKDNNDTIEFIMKYKNRAADKPSLNQEKEKQNTIEVFTKKPLGNLEEKTGLSTAVTPIKKPDETHIPKHLQYDQKSSTTDSAKSTTGPKETIKTQEKQLMEIKNDKTVLKDILQIKSIMDEKNNTLQRKEQNLLDNLGSYKKIIEESQIKSHKQKPNKNTEKVLDDKQKQPAMNQIDQIAKFLNDIQTLGSKKESPKIEKEVKHNSGEDLRLLLSKKIVDEEDRNSKRSITKYMKNYLKQIIPPVKTDQNVAKNAIKAVLTKKDVKPQLKPHLDVFEPLNEHDHIKNYFMEVQEAFRLLLSKKIVDDESETGSTISVPIETKKSEIETKKSEIDTKKSETDTKTVTPKYLDEQENLTSTISVKNVIEEINTTLGQNDKSKNDANVGKTIIIKPIDSERFISSLTDQKNDTKLHSNQLQTKEVKPTLDILDDKIKSTENVSEIRGPVHSKKLLQNDFRLLLSKKILDDESEPETKPNVFVIEDIIERSFLTPYADVEDTPQDDVTYDHNTGSVKLIGKKEFEMISLEMLTQSVRETVDDLLKQNNKSLVEKSKDDDKRKGPKSGLKENIPENMLKSSLLQQSRANETNDTAKKDVDDKPNKTQFEKLETTKDEASNLIHPGETTDYKNTKIYNFIKTNIIRFMIVKAMHDLVLFKSVKILKNTDKEMVPNDNEKIFISIFNDKENSIYWKNSGLEINPVNIKEDLLNQFILLKYILKPKVSTVSKGRKRSISRNYSTNDSGDPFDSGDTKSKKSKECNLKRLKDTRTKMADPKSSDLSNNLYKYWIVSFLNSRGLYDTVVPTGDDRKPPELENSKETEAKSNNFGNSKTLQVGNIQSENGNENLEESEWLNRTAPSSGLCSKIDNNNDDQERSSLNDNSNTTIEANLPMESEHTAIEFAIVDDVPILPNKSNKLNDNVILLGSGKPIENTKNEEEKHDESHNLSTILKSTTSNEIAETTSQRNGSLAKNEENCVLSDASSSSDSGVHPKERIDKIVELFDILLSKLDNKTNNDLQNQINRIKNCLTTFSATNCGNNVKDLPIEELQLLNTKADTGSTSSKLRIGSTETPKDVVVHKNKDVQLMLVPQDNINEGGSQNVSSIVNSDIPSNTSQDLYRQLVEGFIESETTEKACKARTSLNQDGFDKGINKISVEKFHIKSSNNNYYRKDENKFILFTNKLGKTVNSVDDSATDISKVLKVEETDSGISSLQERTEVPKIVKLDNQKCCSREDVKNIERQLNLYNKPSHENKVIGQIHTNQRSKSVHDYIRTAKNTAFNKVVELSDYFIIAKTKQKQRTKPAEEKNYKTNKITQTRPSDKSSVRTRRKAGRAVQRYFSIKFPKKNKSKDGPNSSNKEKDVSSVLKKVEESKAQLLETKEHKKVNKLNSVVEVTKLEKDSKSFTSEVSKSVSDKNIQINATLSDSEKGKATNENTKPIIEVKASLLREGDNILGSELRVTAGDKQVKTETKLLGIEKGKAISFKIGQDGDVVITKIDETSSKKDNSTKTVESKLSHIENLNVKVTKATVKSKSPFLEEFLKTDNKLDAQDVTDQKNQEQQQEHRKNRSELDEMFASFLMKNDSSISETDNNRDKTEEDPRKYEDDATLAEELSLSNDPSEVKSQLSFAQSLQENIDKQPLKNNISELVNSSLEKSKKLNLPMVIKPENHILNLTNKKTYTKHILRLPGFIDILRLKPCNFGDPSINLKKTILTNEYNRLTNLANPEGDYPNDLYSDYLTSGLKFSKFLDKIQRCGLYRDFVEISTMAQLALYTYVKQGINDLYPTNSNLLYKSLQSIMFQKFLESVYNKNPSTQDCNNFYEHYFDILKCLHNNYTGLWESATIPRGEIKYFNKLKSSLDNDRRTESKPNAYDKSDNNSSKGYGQHHEVTTPKADYNTPRKSTATSQKPKVIKETILDEEDDQTTTAYLDCFSKCSNLSECSEYYSLEEASIMPELLILSPQKFNKTGNELPKDQKKTDLRKSRIKKQVSQRAKVKKVIAEKRKKDKKEKTSLKEPSVDEREQAAVPLDDFHVQVNLTVGSQKQKKEIIRKTLTAMTLKLTEIVSPTVSIGNESQNKFVRDPQNDQYIDQISDVSLIKSLEDETIKKTENILKPKPLRVKHGLNIGTYVTSDGNIAYKLESCKPKDQRENVYEVVELYEQEIERKERLLSLTSLQPSTLLCCGINPTWNCAPPNNTPK